MSELICEECQRPGATSIPSQTAYHWDGKGDDPNRSPLLCPDCAADYIKTWQAAWDEWRSSQGI